MKRSGHKGLKLILLAALTVFTACFGGCGKENKYVYIGVDMSTPGMSLYLTYTANGFKKVSNYVFFPESAEESIEKIRMAKQGIDITYLPVEYIGLIRQEDDLKVIMADCFDKDGELLGVWVAKNSWLQNAPNYSRKFIEGLYMSMDYRAEHMNTTYADAKTAMKNVRDFDWDIYKETMEYCAAYSIANKEELKDIRFNVCDVQTMLEMFESFGTGQGEGYELCRRAYDRYKASDSKSFEELFDFTVGLEAMKTVISEK